MNIYGIVKKILHLINKKPNITIYTVLEKRTYLCRYAQFI